MQDPSGTIPTFAAVEQDDFAAVEAGMSVGVQYRANDSTWIGLSIRSPVVTVWGSGSVLSMQTDANGAVLRAADDSLKIEQRLPLNLRLGLGVDLQDWLLAGDVSLSLPESRYESVRAHNGTLDSSTTDDPRYPNSNIPALMVTNPPGPAVPIDIGVLLGRTTVINVSVGAQYRLSPKTALQAGFFTDFSGQPDYLIDELHPHANRYGLTAGVSLKGTSSITTIGLVATLGTGRSFGLDANGNAIKTDAQSEAIYFTLGGSTRLGDPPEKPHASTTEPSESAPPVPEVAPSEQRASQAAPSLPPEQDQSAKSPHAKKKVQRARKKDSE